MESAFFLAQPEPYVDTLDHYRQAIKHGNALVLVCLGVFVGLGSYYAMLGLWRRRMAEAMYAVFIAGNLLYNSAALLVASDLFGVRWFYLVSAPILLSNIAYVLFVMALLRIGPQTQRVLHRAGRSLVGVLAGFIVLAVAWPGWSLELDRVGVALFLIYGMAAAVSSAWRGDRLGRLYLVANSGFFIFGFASISLVRLEGVYTLYVEHLGLAAVTIEVLLLALVLSYQLKPGHNAYQVETRLLSSYPTVPPETRVLTPLKHCPHLLEGQTLCLWRQGSTRLTSRWDPTRFTCIFAVQATWRWLACYEVWHESGEWPLPEAK